jgi:hypothetical protein
MVQENFIQQADVQGRPGLNRDMMLPAVIQDPLIPVNARFIADVDIQSHINHDSVGEPKLQLVDDDLLIKERLNLSPDGY